MPSRIPCPTGCKCGHHPEGNLSPEEKARRARERARDLYLANREAKIAYATAWGKANPERRRAATRKGARKYYARNKETIRAKARAEYDPATESIKARKYNFALSPEETARRLAEQDGCCYLCREPLDLEKKRGVHVDHDHSCCRGRRSCGECIRGLSCQACNVGIGMFGDDPERMIQVAERLVAANAEVVARRATKPVQAELFDIKRAVRRREESA